MAASDIDLLESAFVATEATITGVTHDQGHLPTPCPDFDVARLVDHLVGWADSFAARLTSRSVEGDPNAYRAGADPATEYQTATRAIIGAYRDDAEPSRQLPLGVILMESLVHGWDLAIATGQPVTFSLAAADAALDAGKQMLKPEYRGPDKAFGNEVDAPEGAGPVERLVAFLGRDPQWMATAR